MSRNATLLKVTLLPLMAGSCTAINGNKVTFNNVALRDIRIQAVQTGDFLQPGRAPPSGPPAYR
ncbi:hypothetical protein JHV675_54150 [Mycobacterium avium subsp. hominissuis]